MSTIPPPPPIGGTPDDNDERPKQDYVPPAPPPIADVPPAAPPPPPPQRDPIISVSRTDGTTDISMNVGLPQPTVKKSNKGTISLILGILGFCGITALVGVVFGVMAWDEANRNDGRGKTLAVVATVLNIVWLVIWLFVTLIGNA